MPCHIIFAAEEVDVHKIRSLIVSLRNTQLIITTKKIVVGDAKKVTDDLDSTKDFTEDKSSDNALLSY